jgi:hypothetical protein
VPLATVTVTNVILFAGIFSRMIPTQALISAIPAVAKRGASNAVSASLQQFAGGASAAVAAGSSFRCRMTRWLILIG